MAISVSKPKESSVVRRPLGVVETQNSDGSVNNNAQLLLTTLLQTTIELEPLFDLFFGQIQHLLKLNSCHYAHEEKQVLIKLGTASIHTCDYSLSIQQQYLGKITFSRQQRFSEEELAQLETLLSTLVYPLRNALNYRDALNQALSDPLTGLGNRAALDSALEHQWQMAQRYEQDLSVLMIDIDHFKKVNDDYGHDVGDLVIKTVAQSLGATTRQTDLCYRYGGEEFLVLLNKTSNLGSQIIAERIRENVNHLQLKTPEGKPLPVTVSIGVSHLKPGIDKNTLVKHADDALYEAKHNGRNQVCLYQDENSCQVTGHLSI